MDLVNPKRSFCSSSSTEGPISKRSKMGSSPLPSTSSNGFKKPEDLPRRSRTLPSFSPILQHTFPSPSNLSRLFPSSFLSSRLSDSHRSSNSDSEQGRQRSIDEFSEPIYRNQVNEILSKSFDPKKAFFYDLIKHMNALLRSEKQRSQDERVDFKLRAKLLEAATKVYTSKVDCVRGSMRLLNAFFCLHDYHIEENDAENTSESQPRSRTKRSRAASKIAAHSELLNDKLNKELEIDPLFQKLSTAFSENDIVNSLLMANLHVNSRGLLLFSSSDVLHCDQDEAIESQPMPMEELFDGHHIKCISQSFCDFNFSQRDGELAQILERELSITNEMNLSHYQFDINSPVVDIAHQDADNEWTYANYNDATSEENMANDATNLDLLQLLPYDQLGSNQFFSKQFLKTVYKRNPFNQGKPNAQVVSKPKRKIKLPEPNDYSQVDEDKFTRQTKSIFCLNTVTNWQAEFLQSVDLGFDPAMLKAPFNNFPNGKTFADLMQANRQPDPINCPDSHAQDADSHFETQSQGPPVSLSQTLEYRGLRKGEFRSIKRTMKNMIHSSSELSQQTDILDVGDCPPGPSNANSTPVVAFDEIIHKMSQQNIRPHVNTQFVTLLHLCNEENLLLTGGLRDNIVINKIVQH